MGLFPIDFLWIYVRRPRVIPSSCPDSYPTFFFLWSFSLSPAGWRAKEKVWVCVCARKRMRVWVGGWSSASPRPPLKDRGRNRPRAHNTFPHRRILERARDRACTTRTTALILRSFSPSAGLYLALVHWFASPPPANTYVRRISLPWLFSSLSLAQEQRKSEIKSVGGFPFWTSSHFLRMYLYWCHRE